jgi:hypothetical protein
MFDRMNKINNASRMEFKICVRKEESCNDISLSHYG